MTKKQKKEKKWISWVIIVVLFVVAAVIAFLVGKAFFGPKDNAVAPQTQQRSEKVEEKKTEPSSEEKNEGEVVEKPKVVQYDGEDPNEFADLSGAITYMNVNEGTLIIRVNIDQYVEGGMCNLTLSQNGNVVFGATTGMIENASTVTCDGFDIPIEGFESGKLDVSIGLEADGRGTILMGEVGI